MVDEMAGSAPGTRVNWQPAAFLWPAHLRHKVLLGPVGAELLRKLLQVVRRGLPDAEHLVLQPLQALLPQLLLWWRAGRVVSDAHLQHAVL